MDKPHRGEGKTAHAIADAYARGWDGIKGQPMNVEQVSDSQLQNRLSQRSR